MMTERKYQVYNDPARLSPRLQSRKGNEDDNLICDNLIVLWSHLVSAVRNHGHSLLRNCDVLDMGEMLRARLLDARQKQKTVSVLRKNRMRLYVQPLVLRRPLLVSLCVFVSTGNCGGF